MPSQITQVRLAKSTDVDVRRETRVHIRAVITDALAALTAVDAGDFTGADASLKSAMLAAANGRATLQIALVPTPKHQVDAAIKEWTT